MAQRDILNLLTASKGRWFTIKDISEEIGISRQRISKNMERIMKYQDVWKVYKRERRAKDNNNSLRIFYEYSYQPESEKIGL